MLLMSGYADEVVAHEGMDPATGLFIEKPFSPAALLAKVRSIVGPPPLALVVGAGSPARAPD